MESILAFSFCWDFAVLDELVPVKGEASGVSQLSYSTILSVEARGFKAFLTSQFIYYLFIYYTFILC